MVVAVEIKLHGFYRLKDGRRVIVREVTPKTVVYSPRLQQHEQPFEMPFESFAGQVEEELEFLHPQQEPSTLNDNPPGEHMSLREIERRQRQAAAHATKDNPAPPKETIA